MSRKTGRYPRRHHGPQHSLGQDCCPGQTENPIGERADSAAMQEYLPARKRIERCVHPAVLYEACQQKYGISFGQDGFRLICVDEFQSDGVPTAGSELVALTIPKSNNGDGRKGRECGGCRGSLSGSFQETPSFKWNIAATPGPDGDRPVFARLTNARRRAARSSGTS